MKPAASLPLPSGRGPLDQLSIHLHISSFFSEMMIQPNENDILLGRGGNNNKHVGNAQLRRLVQMHCGAYKKSNKKAKSAIAWELVKYIQNLSPPGRFLRKDPETNEWEIVDDKIAKEKMNQSLRDAVSGKDAFSAKSKMNVKNLAVQHSTGTNTFTNPSSAIPPALPSSSIHATAGMNPEELQVCMQLAKSSGVNSASRGTADDALPSATSSAPPPLLNQNQLSLLEAMNNGGMNPNYSDPHAALLQQHQLQQLQQLQQQHQLSAQQAQMHGLQMPGGMSVPQNQAQLSELEALLKQQALINGRLSDLARHAGGALPGLGSQQLPQSFNSSLGARSVRSPTTHSQAETNTQIVTDSIMSENSEGSSGSRYVYYNRGASNNNISTQDAAAIVQGVINFNQQARQQQEQTVNAVNQLRELIVAEENRKQQQRNQDTLNSLYRHLELNTRRRESSARPQRAYLNVNDRSSMGIETISNISSNLPSEACDLTNFDWVPHNGANNNNSNNMNNGSSDMMMD